MHLQPSSNLTSAATLPTPAMPSFRLPPSYYDQPLQQLGFGQQVFLPRQTAGPTAQKTIRDAFENEIATRSAVAPGPTPFVLQKRQVVVELEIVTVVTVVQKVVNPNPVVVTVNVPPPTRTQVSQGGWPIIDPGSAAACWSDYACNSVCPNFQQNGWYAHCIDASCSQCRCQIISSNMCTGVPWVNATWSSDAPARTIQPGPAIATVTVIVGHGSSASQLYSQMNRRTKLIGLIGLALGLASWLSL